jgi:hypothetical protein
MDQSLLSRYREGMECIDEMEENPEKFEYLYANGDFYAELEQDREFYENLLKTLTE